MSGSGNYDVRWVKHGIYGVFKNGEMVPRSGRGSRAACLDLIEKLQRPRKQKRSCLSCGAVFLSDGFHNRRCKICKAGD